MDKAAKSPAATMLARMDRQGISRRELARRLYAIDDNTSETSWHRMVRKWATDKTRPNKDNAALLARVLGGRPGDYFMPHEHPYTRQQREIEELRRRLEEGDARANDESG